LQPGRGEGVPYVLEGKKLQNRNLRSGKKQKAGCGGGKKRKQSRRRGEGNGVASVVSGAFIAKMEGEKKTFLFPQRKKRGEKRGFLISQEGGREESDAKNKGG